MSTLALIHPTGLLGNEMRELLGRRRELWNELILLSDDSAEVGVLTEVAGAAAVVAQLEEGDLERVDVALFCGDIERTRPLLERLPAGAAAIVLSPGATPEDGRPIVAGVNLEAAERGAVLVSPHPGAVLLAHLVHAWRDFRPHRVTATLMQPVSVHHRQALDEVFEQTRAILRFDASPPREIFPVQVAFNVLPSAVTSASIAGFLRAVLGAGPEAAIDVGVQTLQVGVFHSFGASVLIELGEDPGAQVLAEALDEHPAIDRAVDPEQLGMIDAAGRDEVLVGPVEADPQRRGGYWIWAVMDNLTCGGAYNAVRILETIGDGRVH